MGDLKFEPGELCWAKLAAFPHWPGVVADPDLLPVEVARHRTKSKSICVRFFGEANFAWLEGDKLLPFREYYEDYAATNKKGLLKAIEEARVLAGEPMLPDPTTIVKGDKAAREKREKEGEQLMLNRRLNQKGSYSKGDFDWSGKSTKEEIAASRLPADKGKSEKRNRPAEKTKEKPARNSAKIESEAETNLKDVDAAENSWSSSESSGEAVPTKKRKRERTSGSAVLAKAAAPLEDSSTADEDEEIEHHRKRSASQMDSTPVESSRMDSKEKKRKSSSSARAKEPAEKSSTKIETSKQNSESASSANGTKEDSKTAKATSRGFKPVVPKKRSSTASSSRTNGDVAGAAGKKNGETIAAVASEGVTDSGKKKGSSDTKAHNGSTDTPDSKSNGSKAKTGKGSRGKRSLAKSSVKSADGESAYDAGHSFGDPVSTPAATAVEAATDVLKRCVDALVDAAKKNDVDFLRTLLRRLLTLNVTVDGMHQSGIGKCVRKLMRFQDVEVSQLSTQLFDLYVSIFNTASGVSVEPVSSSTHVAVEVEAALPV